MRAGYDRCVLYNDYHQNIKKTYFNRPQFPWPSMTVKVHSSGNWRNHFVVFGWAVPLADALLWPLWNAHVQAAILWKPAQQNIKNRGQSRFCNTTWAQIIWRVFRSLIWPRIGSMIGSLLPTEIHYINVLLGFPLPRWRSKSTTQNESWARTR